MSDGQTFGTITWSGLGMPVLKYRGGYFAPKTEYDLIWSSILMTLGTRRGSRVMMPEYGAGVIQSVFDPSDQTLYDQIRAGIAQDVPRWDARIIVQDVRVQPDASGVSINVLVRFAVRGREGAVTRGYVLSRNGFQIARTFPTI